MKVYYKTAERATTLQDASLGWNAMFGSGKRIQHCAYCLPASLEVYRACSAFLWERWWGGRPHDRVDWSELLGVPPLRCIRCLGSLGSTKAR